MSSIKLNADGILLLEQPFARVPYENYRKVFRATQRNIEREIGNVQTASNDLLKRSKSREVNLEDAAKSLDGMIGRVENLKRKLSELQDTGGKPTLDVTRERLQHLTAVEALQTTGTLDFSRWADTRLDRWIVDWALRSGREKTARKLAQDKNMETLVDIDLFTDIRRIEVALSRHSCTEALAWCSENKTALRKIKSTLEFELRLQEYIELARAQKKQEAMAYSHKYLASWQETHLPEIMRASMLLAVEPSTKCGRYRKLYDDSRWVNLIQAFRLAIYNLNSLPTEPLLNLALYSGLASLKLPSCYNGSSQNVDCPVCDPSINILAQEVPYSHHANSTIVCRISGKIMDEDNMPLAFPNGNVYSREVLEDMAAKHDGNVICPQSGDECKFSELKKVFIS